MTAWGCEKDGALLSLLLLFLILSFYLFRRGNTDSRTRLYIIVNDRQSTTPAFLYSSTHQTSGQQHQHLQLSRHDIPLPVPLPLNMALYFIHPSIRPSIHPSIRAVLCCPQTPRNTPRPGLTGLFRVSVERCEPRIGVVTSLKSAPLHARIRPRLSSPGRRWEASVVPSRHCRSHDASLVSTRANERPPLRYPRSRP
ncbi:hypothetical protein LX36DRAFT_442794 [Colletotrichum falcatum]|nr:hypothetical protein LX36DRAFT_442794 [Colletotrichum falcatum]